MKLKKFAGLSLVLILITGVVTGCQKNENKENKTTNNTTKEKVETKADEATIPKLFINNEEVNTTNEILITNDNFLLPYDDIAKSLNTELEVNNKDNLTEIKIIDKEENQENPHTLFMYPTSNFVYSTHAKDISNFYHRDTPKIMDEIVYVPVDYLENALYYYDSENNKLHIITDVKSDKIDNNIKYLATLNTIQNEYDNFITCINTLPNDKLMGFNISKEEAPQSATGFSGVVYGLPNLNNSFGESVFDSFVIEEKDKELLNDYLTKTEEMRNKAISLAKKADEYRNEKGDNTEIDKTGNDLINEIKVNMNDAYENLKVSYDNLINQ